MESVPSPAVRPRRLLIPLAAGLLAALVAAGALVFYLTGGFGGEDFTAEPVACATVEPSFAHGPSRGTRRAALRNR